MKNKANKVPLHRRIWCKIRCWQKINEVDDETLARYLMLSVRTLREYDSDAGHLSLERLENFMASTGLTIDMLVNF